MKPVKQEFTNKPEIGQHGDCQRAVIASLLELPISEVPHFLQEATGEPGVFWDLLQAFLNGRGHALLIVPAHSGAAFYGENCSIYHEISGPSPRGNGTLHAVVGLDGNIFFDPHPDGTGLAGDPKDWNYGYLVKI
jgi:hypothetical protein